MLENQPKKILLLSSEPADVSFLSELLLTQGAELELASDAADLCVKISESFTDRSLTAIFVDVSTPELLRNFEYEFQSKLGTQVALELSRIVHFISTGSLSLHREILQSPYFSFFSIRRSFNFLDSTRFYQHAFQPSAQMFSAGLKESVPGFETLRKEMLKKDTSVEWLQKVRLVFERMVNDVFLNKFECRYEFCAKFSGQIFQIELSSPQARVSSGALQLEAFLNLGVSVVAEKNSVLLLLPTVKEFSLSEGVFRFFRINL